MQGQSDGVIGQGQRIDVEVEGPSSNPRSLVGGTSEYLVGG